MKGVYQHCGEQHLHRYLAEFEFRYNYRVALGVDDGGRARAAAAGIVGKRLTYARPNLNVKWTRNRSEKAINGCSPRRARCAEKRMNATGEVAKQVRFS